MNIKALNSLCSTSVTFSVFSVKLHCPYNDKNIQIKIIRFRPFLVDLIQYDWFAPINFFFYLNISLQQINGFKSVFFPRNCYEKSRKKINSCSIKCAFFYMTPQMNLGTLFLFNWIIIIIIFTHLVDLSKHFTTKHGGWKVEKNKIPVPWSTPSCLRPLSRVATHKLGSTAYRGPIGVFITTRSL